MNLLNYLVDQWLLVLAAVTSGALLFWPVLSRGTQGGKVTATQAVQLINREKAVLIDVCEPAEFAAGHAAGSRSVPLGSLEPGRWSVVAVGADRDPDPWRATLTGAGATICPPPSPPWSS